MMPVIPPPILPDAASITDDKDALYGMLISWYMSGYHTGYYQVSVTSVHLVSTSHQAGICGCVCLYHWFISCHQRMQV